MPWTRRYPQVSAALHRTGYKWYGRWVGGSDEAYWRLLGEYWADGETFINVEHDVVVRPDTLRELENCPKDWCAFSVPYLGGHYAGLACVKFGEALLRGLPDALDRAGKMFNGNHPPRHWCTLDHFLQREVLPGAGFIRHEHEPPLRHIRAPGSDERVMPTHGCVG